MLHHQCTDILCPWINNDDKKKMKYVQVTFICKCFISVNSNPYNSQTSLLLLLNCITVFAKVMQTIYCIFSSRDLSSKIWEKIWLKVRGLFKQYNYGKNIGWFCVKYSSWSENQWMKGPYQSIVHSKSKARNFVKFCWQVFALVLQSIVLDRTLALNKPHIRKLTNTCCLGIKKYMQMFCKLLSVSNEQNVHLKYMYMLTQQIRDLSLPLLFHFFNKIMS